MSFTYKGLTAHLNRHIITAEEVDSQLHRLVQQNPRIAVIQDRPTRLGCFLISACILKSFAVY